MDAHRSSAPQHEAEPLWKRIDRLAREKHVTTTQLAKAAGVTWAAAKRWRKPPGDGKNDGSVPELPNLAAIARVFSMSIDELRGIYEKHEPTGEGWDGFKKTTVYKSLTPDEIVRVMATPFPDGSNPPMSAWLAIAEGHIAARPKAI